MKMTRFALSLVAAAALAGCSTAVKLDEPAPVETRPVTQAATTNPAANAKPMAESKVQTVDLGAQLTAAVANQRVVYFDLDSYVVKDEYRGLVDAHAKRLNNDRKIALSLEGHTDERGGREYNLALGQKRAEAVAKSLSLLGVAANQVEAVSFGKERPAAQGSDEAAWSKNRRVELKDK
ncbi:peptidoglycan-associated lipoprotein [Paucibacter aquatile]|uniref:Peptidoglycan-associated lipoprotein n=1 Tax=Kinneretia aquatilis TaxID=2070761 RepID=A0A2N8KRQ3_9BURK|nr:MULTISPECIES: peptidoglycan-associated lipoprotein Pal [Roseateles]MCZ8075106.1 peptidoglycan-associated lipoprotein Pal [Roseateles sp.]OYU27630.1 MAG: peptidoglycan-associated lipoprotein [Burkholderiales bacterium PBB2]PND36147.1 peptidoglycan-associated lipoprotein [Paucibacter aquatile]WIV99544.1 peptidoglycan-associated lipoprotein Pal [Paucibacter aquatile]